MLAIVLAATALTLAALPAVLFLINLRLYRTPSANSESPESISVLIPARNEAHSIAAAVESVLGNRDVELEVVVLDDHSDDATPQIVENLAAADSRVRLERPPSLPAGWNGKQHACWILANRARHDVLVFIDADVRLAPDCLARSLDFLQQSRADLISGVPRQITGGIVEQMLIPLIHFVLLGFLPVRRMRNSVSPAYGAGCGQYFMARRAAYEQCGGHAAIRETLHDGVRLPRLFRAAGFMTDLFDATPLAECRMYRTAGQTWRGLAKNATEGLASPGMIGPATLLLLGGQVLPIVLLATLLARPSSPLALGLAAVAVGLSYLPRLVAVVRFRQSLLGAVLHPLSIVMFLSIQWYALARQLLGRPAEWKGRAYPAC